MSGSTHSTISPAADPTQQHSQTERTAPTQPPTHLCRGRRQPLKGHDVVDAQALQLQHRARQVAALHLRHCSGRGDSGCGWWRSQVQVPPPPRISRQWNPLLKICAPEPAASQLLGRPCLPADAALWALTPSGGQLLLVVALGAQPEAVPRAQAACGEQWQGESGGQQQVYTADENSRAAILHSQYAHHPPTRPPACIQCARTCPPGTLLC